MSRNSNNLKFRLEPGAKITFQTSGKHHFFGYYDKCPWSRDGRFLLAHETEFMDHLPDGRETALIGIIDLRGDKKFKALAETRAWNWQQGAMLQWLGPDFSTSIIFNDFRNGRFVSVITELATGRERIMPEPACAVSPDGQCALSVNFSRLNDLRWGYGYTGLADVHKNQRAPDKDGIYRLNLKSGEVKLIISLAALYNYKHFDLMDQGKHWVDHIVFNHDNRFAFFHRWGLDAGRYYTRLLTANFDGLDPYLLLDTGMASHHSWGPDNQVLVWGRKPTVLASLSKVGAVVKFFLPLYQRFKPSKGFLRNKVIGDNYLLLRDQSAEFTVLGAGVLDNEPAGHCSFSPDESRMLTDTYPDDNYHFRKLLAYHPKYNKKIHIGEFYSLPDNAVPSDWDLSAMRVDLHPRFNRDGTQVCIDSVHEGKRQMYIIDIASLCKTTTSQK